MPNVVSMAEVKKAMSYSGVFPHSPEAERSVLGACILHPDNIWYAHAKLMPEDFFMHGNQVIFKAMCEVAIQHNGMDHLLLVEKLRADGTLKTVGGVNYVVSLAQSVPAAANLQAHINLIREKSNLRKLIDAGLSLRCAAEEPHANIGKIISDLQQNIVNIQLGQDNTVHKFGDVVSDAMQECNENQLSPPETFLTGFDEIDEMTGGFAPCDMVTVAARPGMGKTALLQEFMESFARAGQPAWLCSLEMTRTQLAVRFLAKESGVEYRQIQSGALNGKDWGKLVSAHCKLTDLPLYIDDESVLTPSKFKAKARQMQKMYGVKVVGLDYLQLMTPESTRNFGSVDDVTEFSKAMKGTARELKMPVIALSQLSRKCEERQNKRPTLSDLRGSGAIEQDSDRVLFIFRQAYYDKMAGKPPAMEDEDRSEVIFGKQRNGPTGTVHLRFTEKYARFSSLKH